MPAGSARIGTWCWCLKSCTTGSARSVGPGLVGLVFLCHDDYNVGSCDAVS